MDNKFLAPFVSSDRGMETWIDVLQQRACTEPEKTGFGFLRHDADHDNEIILTYASLDESARRIGAALQQAGLAGERAVLLYQPGPDYVCALMGCLYAGVVAVPIYAPRQNASGGRITQIMMNSRAAALRGIL